MMKGENSSGNNWPVRIAIACALIAVILMGSFLTWHQLLGFESENWPAHAWYIIAAGVVIALLLGWIAISAYRLHKETIALAGRMAASIQQNEARLFGIIQAATEAIITIDEQQKIIIFNPMAEKLFRCSATEAIGTPLSRFIPERFRAAHGEQVTRFGATGISERQMGQQRPLFGLRADGEEFPIEASISQVRDKQGKLYTVMLRDITERKKAEADLQASRSELRQLSANIQSAREEEKTHIARELHDDLGQRLTALKMDLSLLEAGLSLENPKLLDRVRTMHSLIDGTVTAVRRIAADLRPVMLDDLGLISAIEWLAHDFSSRYEIEVELELEQADLQFDSTMTTALFRMIQEALTNVARHAQASKVDICLKQENDQCIVRIYDNGKGMGTEAQRKPKSFGLLGMRERARIINGQLTIDSKAGRGTSVEIRVPAIDTTVSME